MPFIRQARDKRGFDHTYVMNIARGAGGQQQMRVLYLFRSPANLKVGRTALEAEVREALEHTHPDLNFDWTSLAREAVTTRADPPASRQARGPRPGRPPAPAPRPTPVPPPLAVPADDPSLLSQVLGAAEAARLRARHSEIVQRIGRRARSPEERDRLLEQATRLNPGGWLDEATIRAQASTMDRGCEALVAELPSRRRGRRGGRRRVEDGAASPSGIMARGEEHEPSHEGSEDTRVDSAGGAADSGGNPGVSPAGPQADLSGGD